MFMNGIEKTIKHFGSLAAVARALELSGYQVVQQWREAERVPAEHCPRIETLTNGEVLCEDLNDRVDWKVVRDSWKHKQRSPPVG
jgi:DNA-binding transcriptional regulator YdaS (Cro superfamily)